MKRLLTILISVLLLTHYAALGSERRFVNINRLLGTSDRMITSLAKDDYGFVYGASKMGVIRLTDDDYREYKSPFLNGIHSATLTNTPIGMYLWGNNGEIFRYDPVTDSFVDYVKLADQVPGFAGIMHDMAYHNGSLWATTFEGLVRIVDGNAFADENVRGHTRMITESDSTLYYTLRNEIYRYEPETSATPVLLGTGPSGVEVNSLFVDPDNNRILIGTASDGLWTVPMNGSKNTGWTHVPVDISKPIRAIATMDDGTMMLATDGSGIIELDVETLAYRDAIVSDMDDHSSLHGNGVYNILVDSDRGRVWVSTYTDGVSYFDIDGREWGHNVRHVANKPNSLSNNNVNAVIEDAAGMVWLGTDNGVDRWDIGNDRWTHYPLSQNDENTVVLDVCQLSDGDIWVGTYSKGIFVIDSRTGAVKRHIDSINGHPCLFVFDIYQDYYGDVWIGSNSGHAFRYNPKTGEYTTVGEISVNEFFESQPGQIFVTSPEGLINIDRNTNQPTTVYNEGHIVQDCVCIDGIFWMGTMGHGLLRYDPATGTVESFTTANGLPSDYINSLFYTQGNLMVATEKGLCRFGIADHSVQTYHEGMMRSRMAFNTNAVASLSRGDIIWGTHQGALIFNPLSFSPAPSHGTIYIQDIQVNGMSVKSTPEIINNVPVNEVANLTLCHDRNSLKLELVPVNVRAGQYLFSWQMQGVDPDWVTDPDANIVTYNNLDPGKYVFTVRMYDSSHAKLLDQREIHITIKPPFWQTWWASTITAIVLLLGIYAVIRFYKRTLRQEQNEEKIRFFANIAHDIRTSLTLIKAPLELLNGDKTLNKRSSYYVGLVREQTSLLSSVTTQLLDFEKTDSGNGQAVLSPHNIVDVLSRRMSMYHAQAARRNVSLQFESDADQYTTSVDLLKIEKVMDNLITNAIKYTRPGGSVRVAFTHDDDSWTMTFADTGIGIPEKAQKKLFREFYRGENAVNSGVVGSGIGLLVTKKYVDMHHGKISFVSVEDQGTTFTVTIPHAEGGVADDMRTPGTAEPTVMGIGNEPMLDQAPDAQATAEAGADETPKPRMLIVEDNAKLREFMARMFEQDYTVITAVNGRDGWEKAQTSEPDMIISDVMMPEMNGFELCRLLKSSFETSHIPLILLTALSDKTDELEGLNLGADAYITKPFDVPTLQARIDAIMRYRGVVRDYYASTMLAAQPSDQQTTDQQPTDEQQPDMAQSESAETKETAEQTADTVAAPVLNEHNDRFLKKAVETVNKFIADTDFGKDAFAFEVCVSPSLLYKKLKALTGQSPTDFIKNIRLERAMTLLTTTGYTVTEISEMCGFSSVTYFGVAFKRRYGESPSECRQGR